MFPIRCLSCGKLIGHMWEEYISMIKMGYKDEVFEQLGIKRYCCKRIFIGHVDINI